jgi:hypothetical protein
MGAGNYAAGLGPAGFDPPLVPGFVLPPPPLAAIYYDPSIRQYVLTDANGNPLSMDPIDQIVVTRWCTQQGQSTSDPGLGTKLKARFAAADPSKYQSIANDEFTSRVSDLVSSGDVLVARVVYSRLISGANIVQGYYVNLRSQRTNPRNALASAVGAPQIRV